MSLVNARAASELRTWDARRCDVARVLEAADRSQAGTFALNGEWLRARAVLLRLLCLSRLLWLLAFALVERAFAGFAFGSFRFAAAAIALFMAFASARLVTSTPSWSCTPNASPTLILRPPDLRARLRCLASRRLRLKVLSIGPLLALS